MVSIRTTTETMGRTYRHAQRYRQILGVLLRHGYYDVLKNLKLDGILKGSLRHLPGPEALKNLSRAERFRRLLEELGPTFVKAGQLLSTRPDLLPVDVLDELALLQDHVPSMPFEQVRKILEEELGRSPEEFFEKIEEIPLAAASIGQVHWARTVSGREVVIKVQRPGLRRTIRVDLEIMGNLAHMVERRVEGWEVHRPSRVVEELGVSLEKELDYRLEAAHQERFAEQFADDERVRVPRVQRELTTRAVLTMDYLEGVKISDREGLRELGVDPGEVATQIAELTMAQIFVSGFFHGDPHPGNLLVLPGGVLGYLDFGMMGRLNRRRRENLADLLAGIVRRRPEEMAEALLQLCSAVDTDRGPLQRDLAEFADRHFFQPLKDLRLGAVLRQILELAARNQLSIPADFFLTIKALANVEGLCRKLDPDFEIAAHAAPFLERLQWERYYPKRWIFELITSGGTFLGLLRDLPGEVKNALEHIRSGRAKMGFEVGGLEPVLSTLDRVSNRLAFAIVLAALVIGSSLIVLAGLPPLWHEIPLVGLAGFVVAAVMAFWLLVSILKHGRM